MKKDSKKMAKEAARYLRSPEGKRGFKKMFDAAEQMIENQRRKSQFTREDLEEEMTI